VMDLNLIMKNARIPHNRKVSVPNGQSLIDGQSD